MSPNITLSLLIGISLSVTAYAGERSFESLPAAEKQRLRENYERYKSMSAEKKEALKGDFERFNKMSAAEKSHVRENFEKFKKMPRSRQEQLKEKMASNGVDQKIDRASGKNANGSARSTTPHPPVIVRPDHHVTHAPPSAREHRSRR